VTHRGCIFRLLVLVFGHGITKEVIEATFSSGEFILTTLSIARDSEDTVDEYLKILIDKNVAAIAIKNVHHCQISDRTIDYANQHHIPIFQFSDTFIDDLIYIIKNALITNDLNKLRIDKLQGIMNAQNDADVKNLASELNPFFKENCICCCGIPKSEDNPEKAVDSFYEFYNQLVNSQHSAANVTHLLVKGKKCFFLIHSSDSNPSAVKN
jgi:hypothetical protein